MTPQPAYIAGVGSPLVAAAELYDPLATELDSRTLLHREVIPIRSGRAWTAPAGSVVRFTIIEGPQVLDLNIWSSADPRERFWAARTRQFYGSHVSTRDRLWSNLPFLRPLATIIADSIDYGIDLDGAGCHDLLGTRCDPYVNQLLQGTVYDFHCHSNLVRAVMPYGLTEFDIHDVINVFQVTGLMPEDRRYFMKTCPAKIGDYFELFCETDLLMAASTCPGGDLAAPLWGPGADVEPNCNPILVEVYTVAAELLGSWSPSVRVAYVGVRGARHGLAAPAGDPPPLTEATPAERAELRPEHG
jgi:uncharacterized protein YcgI (DUF1989 family)